MKRQFSACQTPRSMYPSIFNSFPFIRTASAKYRRFTYRSPHFCFSWRRPCDYHAICCMDGKKIRCLPNHSQHVPIYLQQFPSYLNCKCKKLPFSRTAAHIFCIPWKRPWGNHAKCCMYGKRIRCLQIVSQHVPIYLQQFPSYSNRKFKKSPFSGAAHIFVSPGDAPATITQYVAWMKRQFNACQTSRSMYLSIFNSFRVIRWLSQCVSPKIAIFTTFLFSLGTPLGQSR